MLTDYHVHLRPDEENTAAARYFTPANVKRYEEAAAERGIAELGVSEHIYRFRQALGIWRHELWVQNAVDDIDAYCEFVRADTQLKLGIEADFIPGAEDRMAQLLEARDFDYVLGSVHFVGAGALDMEQYTIWDGSRSPEQIWRAYFQTLGEAARSGLFDILAHPDLVKIWSPAQPAPGRRPAQPAPGHRAMPLPEGDLRRYYELAMDGIAESGIAVEISTAGLRKPVGEMYPAPEFLRMCVEAGAPIALSSDAHTPEHVGADYRAAIELLESVGVGELCVFSGRSRVLQPLGVRVA